MNQKFKLKLVALVATLSGTAWSSTLAVQNETAFAPPAQQSNVQIAEPAWGGAFGAVQAAQPPADYRSPTHWPTIVSGNQARVDVAPASGISNSAPIPPIVSTNSPVEPAIPSLVTARQTFPEKYPNLLAPIKRPQPNPSDAQPASQPNLESAIADVATIAQASMATTENSNDGIVAPAAQWQHPQGRAQAYLNTGFSSAGVPLYPTSQPTRARKSAAPTSPQEGEIKTFPSPSDSNVNPIEMPPIIETGSQLVSPRDSLAPPMEGYQQPNMNGYGQPAPTPTYFDGPAVEAPVIGAPADSATGYVESAGSVAQCQSCGPNGCYDQGSIDSRSGYFGAVSEARRYFYFDALYYTREDGNIVYSNFGGLGDYDGAAGLRFTLGSRRDATQGYELSFMATDTIEENITRTDPLGRLNTLFAPSSFYTAGETTPFFGADRQDESKQTNLASVELNKTIWGWDVVKQFIGLRYIYMDDSYEMLSHRSVAAVPDDPFTFADESRPAFTEQGRYNMDARNNLIGIHIGEEMFYDVGYRLSLSGIGKLGLYANINQLKTNASKEILTGPFTGAETTFLTNEDNNTTFSTSIELDLLIHFQLTRRARLTAGYNALYLGEMATVSDNLNNTLTPFTGTETNDSDHAFFQGISFGLELYR